MIITTIIRYPTPFPHYPAVKRAVVLAREVEMEEKRLVAYVVADTEAPPSVIGLREFLKERLPIYSIPAAFVMLDALPLLPNGKVNSNGLPSPGNERPDLASVYVEPGTAIEKLISHIWSEILMLERVGIHDNFFDLGGNSFLAIKVQDRLSKAMQIQIPLLTLFQYPTVHLLTKRLSNDQEGVAVEAGGGEDWGKKRRQARQRRDRRAT